MKNSSSTVASVVLALGGAIASIVLVWVLSKPQYTHHEMESGATALVILTLTAMYAYIHWRLALHWTAVPAYLASCIAFVYLLPVWVNGIYKESAPATPEEAAQAFRAGAGMLGLAAVVSIAAWLIVVRISAGKPRQTLEVQ